jgi:hypothetical protein
MRNKRARGGFGVPSQLVIASGKRGYRRDLHRIASPASQLSFPLFSLTFLH